MKTGSNPINVSPALQASTRGGAGKQPDVGALANRVAQKGNFQKQRVVQGVGDPELDKDAFFKLMVTNLKNQDPTNPLKSHEMAAQMAQFSSLEQMSNIKGVLEEMKTSQVDKNQFQALNLIGKSVSGDAGKIQRFAGDKSHPLNFTLGEFAKDVKVSIRDSNGEVVRVLGMTNQPKGQVKLEWDGKDKDGRTLDPGSYRTSIQAKSDKGNVAVQTKFKGQVTGMQLTEKGALLKVGDKSVLLSDIQMVETASPVKPANPVRTLSPTAMAAMKMPAPIKK